MNEQQSEPTQDSVRCPICGKRVEADSPQYPFCCPRCRQIDLGKWITGDYVISRPLEQRDLDEE